MVMSRPPVIKQWGPGAISEFAELGNFGMRVTMDYHPETLSQRITLDTLYGTGVLRKYLGVQVHP